jgi:hypothetical protein
MRVRLISWEYPPVIEGGLGRHVRKLSELQRAPPTPNHSLKCQPPAGSHYKAEVTNVMIFTLPGLIEEEHRRRVAAASVGAGES